MSGDVIVTVTLNAALHVDYTTGDLAPEDIVLKERLHPGRIFLVDTAQGRIVSDAQSAPPMPVTRSPPARSTTRSTAA